MKYKLLITVFLCINSFAQQYDFNLVHKSEWKRKHFKSDERINLFNTNDYSYTLKIKNNSRGLWAQIFDKKRNFIHNFTIKPKDSLRLVYVNSIKWDYYYRNMLSSFSEPTYKKNKTFINYYIYNSENNIVGNYKLEIQKDDIDLFTPFKMAGIGHPYEYSQTKLPFNFKVISSVGKTIEFTQNKRDTYQNEEIKIDSINVFSLNKKGKQSKKETTTSKTFGLLISTEKTALKVVLPKNLIIIEKLPNKFLGISVE
ncbi:hypothetical protein [Urechidicola vernalis]|uniref:DUF3108 domain-containing protein n=1 Tax=Urechidicola vernalis TaxID=3075600 RepID=A0ABU2Y6V1_9FLAO|nr:hypothetical protein [Urechidicola sp. P050]MDT0553925.1 hypothetical protein [Urechidicola sp. P050]